eukprot:scaffold224860_cov18-Tisochrysis_lutea.AAC.1
MEPGGGCKDWGAAARVNGHLGWATADCLGLLTGVLTGLHPPNTAVSNVALCESRGSNQTSMHHSPQAWKSAAACCTVLWDLEGSMGVHVR